MRPILLLLFLIASPALADGQLGIAGAEFRVGATDTDQTVGSALGPVSGDDGAALSLGFAAIDVAITRAHGLQLDAAMEGGREGAIGRLGAHLYMTPVQAQKYGLFATLADLDGAALTWGAIGAEAILSVGRATSVELAGGIGMASDQGLDHIFGSARVAHDFGDGLVVAGGLSVAEFDESGFRAIGWVADLTADRMLSDTFGIFATVRHSALTGPDGADPITGLTVGATLRLGRIGGAEPATRAFSTADPVTQLVRRGYF